MTDHERELWINVAEKLEFSVESNGGATYLVSDSTGCDLLLCGRDSKPQHKRETVAMLHGLACLRCSGSAWRGPGGLAWHWMFHCPAEDRGASSNHPAALIAMLEAHGGEA